MADEKTVFGTKASRLAQLLHLGSDPASEGDTPSDEQARAERLRDLLAAKLPPDAIGSGQKLVTESTTAGLQVARPQGSHLSSVAQVISESIETHLFDTATPIEMLLRIKAYCAKLSRCADSDVEQEAANTIYYAALASALVNQGQRITEFGYEQLVTSFSSLAGLPWLTRSLRGLFKKAVNTCEKLIKPTKP